MQSLRAFILLILLSFAYLTGQGQSPSYSFIKYDVKTINLSHNSVTSLFLDKEGLLWVGTIDGLNRFDGTHIQTYRHDPADPKSISNNFIHGISQDEDGLLWITTRGGGINRFDPVHETFSHFKHSDEVNNGIPDAPVYMTYTDKKGRYWVSYGRESMGILNTSTGHYKNGFIMDGETRNPVSSPNSITEFNDGSMLAVSFDGLFFLPDSTVTSFAENSEKEFLYARKVNLSSEKQSQNLFTLFAVKDTAVWMRGASDGVFTLPWSQLPEYIREAGQSGIFKNSAESSYSRRGKYLLTGGGSKGISLINTESLGIEYIQPANGSQNITVENLYEDRRGELWSHSWGNGFEKLREEKVFRLVNESTNPELTADFILSFEEEQKGGIWIGTGEGLIYMDRDLKTVWDYTGEEEGISSTIWSLSRATNGLWITTIGKGLYYLPVHQGKPDWENIRNFTPANSFLKSYQLHQAKIDSRGWLWIGYEGDGLQLIRKPANLLDGRLVKVTEFQGEGVTEFSIAGNNVREIYEDKEGNIWLAMMQSGFRKITIQGEQITRVMEFRHNPEDPNSVSFNDGRSIYQQNDSTFWFATYGRGINRWNKNTGIFTSYTDSDGLANNSTYGILPDKDPRYIWISTNNGLSRLNTENMQFSNFNEKDGLQSREFNTGAFHQLKSGELLFGGVNGFNILDSGMLIQEDKEPAVFITGIKVFNEALVSDSNAIYMRELELDYDQNFLSFEFAAPAYNKPSQNIYAYKMEGIDEQWVEAGNRTYADYPNLEPGSYVFRVKAANSYGVWNEDGIRLSVNITPPWWETWWFYSLSGLSLFILMVAGIRYISQRKLREQIRRMEVENKLRNERERISRDLHDHVGAQLANIISGLNLIERYNEKNNTARSAELMSSLRGDASVTIKQLRETIWALNQNSLELEDFVDHLKKYFQSQSALSEELQVHYHQEVEEKVTLSSTQALNVFRIIQEASQNTLKYAGAKNMNIHFSRNNGSIFVCIKDDGTFKENGPSLNGGYGIGNMRKRAEELGGSIEINKNSGTEIKLSFKL